MPADDELLDVNGVSITGMSVAEVGQVIRTCPKEFLATVRPLTAHKRVRPPDVTRVNYVTVLPILNSAGKETSSSSEGKETAILKIRDDLNSSCDSLADVGDYDDEEEDGSPPPVPVRTEDMLLENTQAPLTSKIWSRACGSTLIYFIPSQGSRNNMSSVLEVKDVPSERPRRVHVYEDVGTNYVDVAITPSK